MGTENPNLLYDAPIPIFILRWWNILVSPDDLVNSVPFGHKARFSHARRFPRASRASRRVFSSYTIRAECELCKRISWVRFWIWRYTEFEVGSGESKYDWFEIGYGLGSNGRSWEAMVEGKPNRRSKSSDVGVWIEQSSVSVSMVFPSVSSLLSWVRVQLVPESISSSSSDAGGSQEVVAKNVSFEGRLSCLRFCLFRPNGSNELYPIKDVPRLKTERELGGMRGMYCGGGPNDFSLSLSLSRSLARNFSWRCRTSLRRLCKIQI